jgi:hypothetical protein
LRESFAHVRALRIAQLAGRPLQVDTDAAISDLLPLAQNYLQSDVFRRVQSAARIDLSADPPPAIRNPQSAPGLWSELRFRLRRPLGTLTGTIDKLLITPSANGIDVEIIDFKTNRFPRASGRSLRPRAVTMASTSAARSSTTAPRGQATFDFETASEPAPIVTELVTDESVDAQIENAVRDYRLQMQAYALAFRELVPRDVHINSLRVTLHFIQPNVEKTLDVALLEREACAHAVDEAMSQVIALDGTIDAEDFPASTNAHCRTCGFLEFCSPGQDWQKIQNRER